MLQPLVRAVSQLNDPVFLGVVWRSLVLSLLAFLALLAGSVWLLASLVGDGHWLGGGWLGNSLGWLAGILGGAGVLLLAVWLFVPIALLIATLYIDRVAGAVERRYYPGLPPPAGAPLAEQTWDGVILALQVLVLQIVTLIASLLLPGLGLVLGYVITGWAIGPRAVRRRRHAPHAPARRAPRLSRAPPGRRGARHRAGAGEHRASAQPSCPGGRHRGDGSRASDKERERPLPPENRLIGEPSEPGCERRGPRVRRGHRSAEQTSATGRVRLFKRRKPEDAPTPGAPPGGVPSDKLEVGMPSPSPFDKPARADDPGVGASPSRPFTKEFPMGRTPYPSQPQPQPQPPGSLPISSSSSAAMPGASMPGGSGGAPRPGMQPPRPREAGERRTLVVGRGISVQGTVQDAERLVVEGTVEASMIRATELSITQGGVFKGAVEVEEAEIAGTIDGTLTARGNLIVRATGKVLGTANYRRLQVEDGGQITGELKMITEPARPESSRAPAESAAS